MWRSVCDDDLESANERNFWEKDTDTEKEETNRRQINVSS